MPTHTNQYYIEKSRMPVAVTLLGGERLAGELFIQASARYFSALEDAPEFMNAPEQFFPFRLADGTTVLIAKEHVLAVDVPHDHVPASSWTFGETALVEVVMQEGSTHRGVLQIEHFAGHERVLDHLNRVADVFLALQRPDGMTLVNRFRIVLVRPLDDGAA
jgi:hypothetical protein